MGNRLLEEIRAVINRASRENASDTPDFILAEFLYDSLEAFEKATRARTDWSKPNTSEWEKSAAKMSEP